MKIRIGSRKSPLAVTQAEWVASQLKKSNSGFELEFIWITTQGDRDQTAPSQNYGKGVFVKEIEEALLADRIDLAVHSLKDVPQNLPTGLCLGPFPERQDNRDALISRFGEQLEELPKHSTIGTNSPRRRAQILNRFKKRAYRLEALRGNVDTRLKKLHEGLYDAVVLAVAGLERLGRAADITQIIDYDVMLPAPCQGCLGIEHREKDNLIADLLQVIRHPISDSTARSERAFLQGIGGDCLVPLGAASWVEGDQLRMEAVLLSVDGGQAARVKHDGPVSEPEMVGAELAEKLLYEGGSEILMESHPGASRDPGL